MKRKLFKLLSLLLCMAMVLTFTPAFSVMAADWEITEISITGDITPVAGDKVGDHLSYTLPENCHYTVSSTANTLWYCEEDSSYVSSAATFEAGKTYYVAFSFAAVNGYKFVEGVTVTINGETTAVNKVRNFTVNCSVETVPIMATATIDTIELTANVEAVAGDKASDHLSYSLPEDAHCKVTTAIWYDDLNGNMKNDDTFVAGGNYYRYFRIEPDTGYEFTNDVAVTINGSAETIDTEYSRLNYGEYILFTLTEAAKTPINEITVNGANLFPVYGDKAGDHLSYTLPENCHYTVSSIAWSEGAHDELLDGADIFLQEGYQLKIRLQADDGYMFVDEEDTTVTVNGFTDTTLKWRVNRSAFTVFMSPMNAAVAEGKTITEVAIYDADVTPVIGEAFSDHEAFSIPENVHYSVTESAWRCVTPGSETLTQFILGSSANGNSFVRRFVVEPEFGYVFADDVNFTLNGEKVTPTNATNAFVVFRTPSVTIYPPIDRIQLSNVLTNPIGGETAASCSAYQYSGSYRVEDCYWWDETSDCRLSEDDVFEAGNPYHLEFKLSAPDGYTFATDTIVTVNGGTELLNKIKTCPDATDNALYTVCLQSVEAKKPIHNIEITADVTAAIGETVGAHSAVSLPEDAPYEIDPKTKDLMCGWFDPATELVYDSATVFEAGEFYFWMVPIVPKEGYEFASDLTITINGDTQPLTEENAINFGGSCVIYLAVEATEPKPSETTVDLRIGDKEFYGVKGGETLVVESLDAMQDITVLVQNGVDIEGMSEDWSMSTKFLDSEGRGVLEVQVFEEGDDYVTFNLQSHYADCPGASVDDFQIMMITVKVEASAEKLLGDANDDGAVNMKDVLLMRKYLAGMDVEYNAENADCNGDGDVNMKDVLMLRKYLAGIITELG